MGGLAPPILGPSITSSQHLSAIQKSWTEPSIIFCSCKFYWSRKILWYNWIHLHHNINTYFIRNHRILLRLCLVLGTVLTSSDSSSSSSCDKNLVIYEFPDVLHRTKLMSVGLSKNILFIWHYCKYLGSNWIWFWMPFCTFHKINKITIFLWNIST